MGTVTPNIGIYIPAAGETNYDQSFQAGMVNVDQHDHSGAPNKGVPIATSGLADDSVTYPKLNANVADTATGIGPSGSAGPNQLAILGLLRNIYQIATPAGFIAKNGSLATARTITGTANQIAVTNGDGAAGNPTLALGTNVVNANQVGFKAVLSSNQNNKTGNNTIYAIPFNTVIYQNGSSYNNTTGEFTVPQAGRYLIVFNITLINLSATSTTQLFIDFNGVNQESAFIGDAFQITNGNTVKLNGSFIVSALLNDVITARVNVNGIGADTVGVGQNSTFAIVLLPC